MKSMNDALVIDMAKAVHYQLSYINTVARAEVLAESCFRLPAIEYIERHPNLGFTLFLEHPHLVYKYRRIDLSWGKKGAETPTSFLEMKYVKNETANIVEQQRFYNDLVRQAAILFFFKKAKCYFLASGLSINWDNCFINTYKPIPNATNIEIATVRNGKRKTNRQKVKSIYNNWFSFDIQKPGRVFTIDTETEYHSIFQRDYEQRTSFPEINIKRIRTRLLWISGAVDSSTFEDGNITGIWEVMR